MFHQSNPVQFLMQTIVISPSPTFIFICKRNKVKKNKANPVNCNGTNKVKCIFLKLIRSFSNLINISDKQTLAWQKISIFFFWLQLSALNNLLTDFVAGNWQTAKNKDIFTTIMIYFHSYGYRQSFRSQS